MVKKVGIEYLIIGTVLLILALGAIGAIFEIENQHQRYLFLHYNEKFIPALLKVSDLIPQGSSVVVSHVQSYLKYFISHEILTIPDSISSEKSLVYYMVDNNSTYLLVYDNRHYHPEGAHFTERGSKNSLSDYKNIAKFIIDDRTKFQLYQLNKNWTDH